ncbi:MAG: AAA family ATPase [Myxococcota bacterium]|nr:AAA family ATPase [Myxococcota bacterium]
MSFQALKREFGLDDQALHDLVAELVDVQQVALREGRVVSWVGSDADRSVRTGPERRQLTVMFCDLVGSSGLAERLDAEDLRDVLGAYHDSATRAIERYGGHVAQYLGDGVLAYFGYPQAHEDDAERSAYAGLELLRAIEGLNETLEPDKGIRIAARIGVHTGNVVVGDLGAGASREHQALGATTIIASRLQEIADPGSLVISSATLRLVRGAFRIRDLGTPPLKGIREPIRAHAVLGPSGIRSHLDVDPGHLTPFVGRRKEMELLLERWSRVQAGRGQAVAVHGEAGFGKSRLLRALCERLSDVSHTWLECQCSRYTQRSAFHPLIQLIEQAAGFDQNDTPEQKLRRLEEATERAGLVVFETVPFLASILSLQLPDRYPPLEFSADFQHRKTIAALVSWALARAKHRPLVLMIEDLQWCDSSTLDFLTLLIEESASASVMTLLSFRSGFSEPWEPAANLSRVEVGRLDPRDSGFLVNGMNSEGSLPAALLERIVERADGVPLFLEELTKMMLEAEPDAAVDGSDPIASRAIPATLQDLLMARLDRLGGGKEVAQLGAVLGREFPFELLRAVSPADDASLAAGLRSLIDAGLLLARGTPPVSTYAFTHALTQDTAYQSMLRSARRRVHARTATALEEQFPARASSEPEVVARHFDEAGLVEPAVAYYRRAARRANRQSASQVALAQLQRALDLIGALPEGAERNRQELELQLEIIVPLYTTRGWADAEYGERLERALSLAKDAGSQNELFNIWVGLYVHHQVAGRLPNAEECARRALAVAEKTGDPRVQLFARAGLSQTLYLQGDFVSALEAIERASLLQRPGRAGSLSHQGGRHLHRPLLRALCRWTLGFPDQALEIVKATRASAREEGPPFDLASAHIYAGWILQKRGAYAAALDCARDAVELCERLGLSWLPWAVALRGAVSDPCEQAVRDIERGIASLESSGTRGWMPHCFSALAEVLWKLGDPKDALAAVDRGLHCGEVSGQHYEDSELLRLRGEIMATREEKPDDGAGAAFEAALELTRRQQARSLELRAAMSLARLWQRQGRTEAARELLLPVHEWFSEGFETQDWKRAEVLLAELR